MADVITNFAQPVLIALAVLLIPASVRMGVRALSKKLDEGRVVAEAQRELIAVELETHRVELMTELGAIKEQTTLTNGKVAEHDRLITVIATKTELLTELYLKSQPDKGV